MRSYEGSLIKVTYPDDVAFVFNPCRVIIEAEKEIQVALTVEGLDVQDVRTSRNGRVEYDVSKYLQTQLDKDVRGKRLYIALVVSTTDGMSGEMFDFTVYGIWGALNIGEAYNEPRTVQWFENYPFAFDLYIPGDAQLQVAVGHGDGVSSFTAVDFGTGLVSLNPKGWFPLAKSITIRLVRGDSDSVFDYTFDHTFRDIVEGGISDYVIMVNDGTCGMYLRWIDRHGKMQYYLFEKGQQNQVDKAGDVKTGVFTGESYEYLTTVYERKEATHSVMLCAPMVDEDTLAMLKTLNTSPYVELYYNGQWLPVNIEPLTIQEKPHQVLRDYEVTMIYPVMMIQAL